jgi:hypothetical protein
MAKLLSRRSFLITGAALSGTALVAAVGGIGYLSTIDVDGLEASIDGDRVLLNAFVVIQADGQVVVNVPRTEMGQGIHTGLAMVVAEELDLPFDERISVVYPTEPRPAYPRLELAFMEGKHEGLSRRLKEGEIDLVITACPVLDEAFQQVELLNEPFHLLTSVENPVIQRDQIEPADLAKLDLLPLSEDDFPMSMEDSTLRFVDRSNGPILRSYGLSIETRVRLVREQGYSCLVPSIACGQSINGTQFALAEIKGKPVRRQIFALWRRSSPYPVDLENFAKELAILLKEGQRSVSS